MVEMVMLKETIKARGHKNVTAKHRTTLEFTKEKHLTPQGDCIIVVGADKSMREFSEEFKSALRDDDAELEIRIKCKGLVEIVRARGNSNLILTHPTDMVIRKSDFVCDRTLAVRADKASIDLDRKLVERLKEGNEAIIEFNVKP